MTTCERGWTVILIYPDYMQESCSGVKDYYATHSAKVGLQAAVGDARKQAYAANCGACNDPLDFAFMCAIRGIVLLEENAE